MSNEILVSLAERINAEHAAAVGCANKAIEHARQCGELLIETKAQVGHGEWLPWLADHCEVSQRQAWAYMQVAEGWDELTAKLEPGSNLSIKGALRLLSPPEEAAAAVGRCQESLESVADVPAGGCNQRGPRLAVVPIGGSLWGSGGGLLILERPRRSRRFPQGRRRVGVAATRTATRGLPYLWILEPVDG
jgi:hypothetical protein